MTRNGKSALWYARHGWHILPIWQIDNGRCACGNECESPGKHPIASLVGNGLKNATTNANLISQWWSQYPDANLATTSFLRVDVDTKNNGPEHWQDLQAQNGRIDTVHCMTPSGGAHFYFRAPADWKHSNGTGQLPSGIDIRGDGTGYTLLPPSNHVAGVYEWEVSSRPDETEIAAAPDWLLEMLFDDTAGRVAVTFNGFSGKPELEQWELSSVIEAVIQGDRSRIDQAVITALAAAGADDDEIRAVFTHYPTTGKYGEKGTSRDKYLALSISKARAWLQQQQPEEAPPATVNGNGRGYVKANQLFRRNRVTV